MWAGGKRGADQKGERTKVYAHGPHTGLRSRTSGELSDAHAAAMWSLGSRAKGTRGTCPGRGGGGSRRLSQRCRNVSEELGVKVERSREIGLMMEWWAFTTPLLSSTVTATWLFYIYL